MRIVKKLSIISLLILSVSATGQRIYENIDHGLVAVKVSEGVYVSWRVLASETDAVSYNLYREGTLLNDTPITGASNYSDLSGTEGAVYELRKVINETEIALNESCVAWSTSYLDIPVSEAYGSYAKYEINDASVGDLDGDGQYEIVVKRLANDMSIESTDYHLLEAYKLDGTLLWSVNMGPNIYNKAEFNFLVWDFDMDGKAEVATRTSEGFIDGLGNQIGDIDGDHLTNYRNYIASGYRYKGPDFLSVLDGETGEEIARADYIAREPISQWGLPGQNTGQLAHRSTKCMFAAAYLDGKTPSIVISRGIYEKVALAAWNFRDGELSQLWYFDSDQPQHTEYNQEGYHNLTMGDVDNDGRDEIMYGSMCVDDDGTGLYTTNLGHGDAQHLADINPNWYGIEYFGCNENATGGNYRNAETGEIFFYHNIGRDMGRAGCADVTPDYPGMEMWGPSGFPFLSSEGKTISNLTPPSSMNFFIWWDGDPIREMLDHWWTEPTGVGTITKYNNGANTRLLTANGTYSNNWTKGNPCLSADILGDWREEVIWRTEDNSAMRLYTTKIPTDHRIYTLMQDPQYRAAIAWQPNSYNQPPHPGFFIGHDMDSIPPAPIMLPGQITWSGGTWDVNITSAWDKNGTSSVFTNGDSILFDVSGSQETVTISDIVEPSDMRVITPGNYTINGDGSIAGTTNLTKDGIGKLTLQNENSFTGITRVWEGELSLSGILSSQVLVKRFATVSGNGVFNNGLKLEKYAKMIVSSGNDDADTLFIQGPLSFASETQMSVDLSNDPSGTTATNDIILIDGDLSIEGLLTIHVNPVNDELSTGNYVLASCTGTLTGSAENLETTGIEGTAHLMKIEGNQLILEVPETRPSTSIVWEGSVDNEWDIFNKLNWLNDGQPDVFIGNDTVVFNDQAKSININLTGNYAVSHLLYDASLNMSITGEGSIAGEGSLLKKGSGSLTLSTANTYMGQTRIEEGILRISELTNGGVASGLGAASSAAENIVIDGGTLEISGSGTRNSDRLITVGPSNGAISLTSGSVFTFSSGFTGEGYLEKKGNGTMVLKNNQHKGTIISSGVVQLADEDANYNGLGDTVVFQGGQLYMYDNVNSYTNNCPWDIVVEEGESGYIRMDSRGTISGSLTGGGDLSVYLPYVRSGIAGNWSNFTGNINCVTDSDGGWFLVYNNYGFKNAAVHLSENIEMKYMNSENVTVEIGELTGPTNSYLASGGEATNIITWKVGGKNTNFTFDGVINNWQVKNSGAQTAIIKTGTGMWTLTNANVYTGGTKIEQGILNLANTSGSATGTGLVTVMNEGTITGTGSMSSNLNVLDNGTILTADGTLNYLTIGGNVVLSESTMLMMDLNSDTKTGDYLSVGGDITLDGTLYVSNIGSSSYTKDQSFQLFLPSGEIKGSFKNILPKTPGEGLEWDTTFMQSIGLLRIVEATGLKDFQTDMIVKVYPNPFSETLNIVLPEKVKETSIRLYNMDGREIRIQKSELSDVEWKLHTESLRPGSYILNITNNTGESYRKILIKH